ncbi:MAG: HEAT repeat domain-containing protein [Pseudoxanthomonas sp.]
MIRLNSFFPIPTRRFFLTPVSRVLLFLGALQTPVIGCNQKDKSMNSSERAAQQSMLDHILDAPDEKTRGEALRIHGPVRSEELPHIEQRAREASRTVQRNAVWLLRTARDPEAAQILRRRLAATTDAVVFALAFDSLRGAPDAQQLAAAHKDLITEALQSQEPEVFAAGLHAAALAALPELPQILSGALAHPEQKVRDAAVDVIAQLGSAPAYEPQLRGLLLGKDKYPVSDYTPVYIVLTQSTDAVTAGVLQHALQSPRPHELLDFSNALLLGKSRQPWLRDLLLDFSAQPGELGATAFGRLAGFGQDPGWGPAVYPALVQKCLATLENAPPEGSTERHRYLVDCEPCREFLGRLAGTARALRRKRQLQQSHSPTAS